MQKKGYLVITFFILFHASFGQKTIHFTDKNAKLRTAIEHIEYGHYPEAASLLTAYLKANTSIRHGGNDFDIALANYYIDVCALHLAKPNAAENFQTFLAQTVFKQLQEIGNFELAKYYVDKGNYPMAIPCYEKSGINFLTNQEISERNFQLAYAYLVTQRLDKVDPLFASVKNIHGDYFKPGNYYYGILSYYKGDYPTAKESFLKVAEDEKYKNIVPFYLLELSYLTGHAQEVLDNAKDYLDHPEKLYYSNELNQLVGQIYLEEAQYANAETYFKKYIEKCLSPRKEDYFRLAYAQYQQKKVADAITNFEVMSKDTDKISQQAYYLLAKSYLTQSEKQKAFNALQACIAVPLHADIVEIAEYNLAKLSYDIEDEITAEKRLNQFMDKYPKSDVKEEVAELITFLHLKNDRFDDAMIMMNKLVNMSDRIKKIYQRANYARGVQLLISGNSDLTIPYFNEAMKYPMDESINNLASFWHAEALYRLGRYDEAMSFADYYLDHSTYNADADNRSKMHLMKTYIYFQKNDKENQDAEFQLVNDLDKNMDSLQVLDSVKPNFVPDRIPIIDNDPYVLTYNMPEEEFKFQYTPVPLKPLAMDKVNEIKICPNYAKIGIGNLSTISLEAGADISDLIKMPWYVNFKHTSSKGKIKNQQVGETHFGIYDHRVFQKNAIETSFTVDENKVFYYGYDHDAFSYAKSDVKQRFLSIGVQTNIKPLHPKKYHFDYETHVYLGLYTDSREASETNCEVDMPISKEINNEVKVNTGFALNANFYHVGGYQSQSNSMLMWKPSIAKTMHGIDFAIGLYPVVAQKFHVLPDITATKKMPATSAMLIVGLQSKLVLNTFKQMTTLNPFLFNYFSVKQSKNTELFAGLNGNLNRNCSYTLKTGFATFKNLPLFLQDTTLDGKQFSILYASKITAGIIDASIDYTLHKNFRAGASIQSRPILSLSSSNKAWHYVSSEMSMYGEYRASDKIVLRSDLFWRSGYSWIQKSMQGNAPFTKMSKPGLDMNIAGLFEIKQQWKAYLDIHNLFGSKYQQWHGYSMFGPNLQLGIIHSFENPRFVQH